MLPSAEALLGRVLHQRMTDGESLEDLHVSIEGRPLKV